MSLKPEVCQTLTWYFPGLPSLPRTESRVGGGSETSESREGELRLILGKNSLSLCVSHYSKSLLYHLFPLLHVCWYYYVFLWSLPWFLCPDGSSPLNTSPLLISCHNVTEHWWWSSWWKIWNNISNVNFCSHLIKYLVLIKLNLAAWKRCIINFALDHNKEEIMAFQQYDF